MASFNVTWGIAADLAQRGWLASTIAEADDLDARCAEFVTAGGDRPIVVVARDIAVHGWQGDVIDRCVAAGRTTVVVEMGWPGASRPPADAYIVTHGAARASAQAVIGVLSNESLSNPMSEEN